MSNRRKAYPPRYQPRKAVFSATGWAKWLSSQPAASPSPDERTVGSRANLDAFRSRVVIGKERP